MKTNRLFIVCMMVAIGSFGNLWAQQDKAGKANRPRLTPEQRIEMQVKQMQKHLLLDEATAAKFAPLYTEYLNALKSCHPKVAPKACPKKELTDAELDQQMQDKFAMRKKILETQETYYNKFKKILNIRQVEKLFRAQPHKRMHAPKCQPGKLGCPAMTPAPHHKRGTNLHPVCPVRMEEATQK